MQVVLRVWWLRIPAQSGALYVFCDGMLYLGWLLFSLLGFIRDPLETCFSKGFRANPGMNRTQKPELQDLRAHGQCLPRSWKAAFGLAHPGLRGFRV